MGSGILAIMKADCPCCGDLLIGTMSSEVVDRFQVEYDLQLQRYSEDIKLETKIPYFSPIYRRAICPNCGRIVIGKIELTGEYKNKYILTLEEEVDVAILEQAFKAKAPLKERYWDDPKWQERVKQKKDRAKSMERKKKEKFITAIHETLLVNIDNFTLKTYSSLHEKLKTKLPSQPNFS